MRSALGFLVDMDGVIYRGSELIPGAKDFIDRLLEEHVPFLFLTNNSQRTRRDVATRLVFETFDGSFVQVAQEMELLVFLWPDKRRKEDYFYKEIGKFRETCQKLFKGVIANLMKMRNSPLRFTPRDRPFDKTG